MDKDNIAKPGKLETYLVLAIAIALLVLINMVMEKAIPASFNTITGDVISTVNITQTVQADCNFTFSEGINLVSFFCIPIMVPRDDVLGSLSGMEYVFEYQEGQSDPWKAYNPSLPSFVIQDLTHMSRIEGYWIKMSAEQQFFLEGGLRLPTEIPFMTGWNLAGYPKNTIEGVSESFATIEGNYTEARTYIAETGTTIGYVPGVGGALNQTEPYRGYWINATVDEEWVVD